MNKWISVREFVNSHKKFTKKEMRKELNIDSCSNYTESQYISNMLKVGFIKRIGRGSYERLIKVPITMSTNKMQILIYDEDKKSKLLTTLMRKEKLENLRSNNS